MTKAIRQISRLLSHRTVLILIALGGYVLSTFVIAQGPLLPPGAPAPTMKTLEQVEPRTPIESLPFTISQSGSYFVTDDLTGSNGVAGITITASDVTLDLSGFTLFGVAGSLDGIDMTAAMTNNLIRNGTLRGWGQSGIRGLASMRSCTFEGLRLIENDDDGIVAGSYCVIRRCMAIGNGLDGFRTDAKAQVEYSTASGNGADGFDLGNEALVTYSSSSDNADFGIRTGFESSVIGAVANDNEDDGIRVSGQSIVSHCQASGNTTNGFTTGFGSTVLNSHAANNNRGYFMGGSSLISYSKASGNQNDGIVGTKDCMVYKCVAVQNVGDGVLVGAKSSVVNTTSANNQEDGISFLSDGRIDRCIVSGNSESGIELNDNGVVLDSSISQNVDGITATRSDCFIRGNYLSQNTGAAIDLRFGTGDHRIEGNSMHDNNTGLNIASGGSIVFKNTAEGNTVNYSIANANKVGSTLIPPNSGPINGSTGGAGLGTNDPWANFSY
ncbi:MAG: right-handed parallel beta-helix repeat-containing protein [Verrucomicrobiota bacterium]